MGLEIKWRSVQGRRTGDNRDQCGVGRRDDTVLCVVLDGSTSGENSGELARLLARGLIDWFVTAEEVSAPAIVDHLRRIHADPPAPFRKDSASLVAALVEGETVTCLHAGDCLAGIERRSSEIDWLTRPHTLADLFGEMSIEEIARSHLRNRITRSFRAREFMEPDVCKATLGEGERLVLATDGFWATLDHEGRARYLAGDRLPPAELEDDCSALSLDRLDDFSDVVEGSADNLYLAL